MIGNPKPSASDLTLGERRECVVVQELSRTQIVQYAGASGDFNPVHIDETFAVGAAGYPTVFAHGMLSMGLTATLLTDWLGDGVLTQYGVRFVAQVWPGDTLIASATISAIDIEGAAGLVELEIVTRNQHDETVLTGKAVARLPA